MAKTVQLDERGYRKFGIRDRLAYAAGDLGCNMSFALKGTVSVFWTQYMQVSLEAMAILLLIVQIWDAINDPVIGSMVDADKHVYKRNKFLQYIWVGSIGLLVAGAAMFLPFPQAPMVLKYVMFVLGYILWDAFYTIANVPYGSLLSLISDKPADRASLSAWRSVGSLIAQVATMVLLPILIYDANNNIKGETVFIIALVMGAIGFVAFQFMIRNTTIRVDENINCNEDAPKFNLLLAMKNFAKNRPAVGATLAAMGMFLGMQGATTAVTVMFQSYFKNVALSGVVSAFAMIPIIAFTPLARKLVVKYGKKELATFGAACSVAACVLMLVLPISPNGVGLVMYILCQFINALGMGIYSTVSWGMMGDAIDYNEWKNGTREEGTVYSLHSFFRKLAQGLGPSLALFVMAGLGYNEINAGNQLFSVALNMRYLVAALYLVSAAMQLIGLGLVYNLDKKSVEQMNKELAARHAKSEEVE